VQDVDAGTLLSAVLSYFPWYSEHNGSCSLTEHLTTVWEQ